MNRTKMVLDRVGCLLEIEEKINKNIIEKALLKNKFTVNTHGDAYDKGDFRVFFDDTHVIVVRFVAPRIQEVIKWKNKIDGNMASADIIKLINTMVKL